MDFFQKVLITIFIEEIFVFIPLSLIFFYVFYNLIEKTFSIKSCLVLFLPLFFIFYHYSYLPNFFSSLGQDSLIELDADLGESLFYIKTFFSFLFDVEIFKRNRFWLILFSSLLTGASLYFIIKYYCKIFNKNILYLNNFFKSVFILVVFVGIYKLFLFTFTSLEAGKNLKILEAEFRKNISKYNIRKNNQSQINTFIYVGESTSVLNMSLYGYPFDTTPWLESLNDDYKFIKFNNVFATHTHTTPSLMSAFSLCIEQAKENCSINYENNKRDLSIIDVLSKTNVDTTLYSTQGTLGGHNLANKLVFNTKKKYFSVTDEEDTKNKSSKLLGNRYKAEFDDLEFFKRTFCKNQKVHGSKNSSLTIFHTYAGHGQYDGYLEFVPEGLKFDYPEYINKKNFLGKDYKNFKLINEYDTAVRYIDSSLKTVFKCIGSKFDEKKDPVVFVYFSDHGESPATARGHDSSRLTYEMLHVPLLIFFNEAAHKLHQKKFNKLKSLENKKFSLRFISDLILYLNDVDVFDKNNFEIYNSNKFKSLDSKFILGRKNLNNQNTKLPTFWNYKENEIKDKDFIKAFSKQDTSINIWQLNNFLENKEYSDKNMIKNLLCKHRANSFIEQYKASLINGCFETDILFLKDKTISAHEIAKDTDLKFENFFFSNYKENIIWLDSKNVNKLENCLYAKNWLEKNSGKFKHILFEIPSSSIKNLKNNDWKNCIENIKKFENIDVGYYMPTNKIKACSDNNLSPKLQEKCESYFIEIMQFLEEIKINNITFDFNGYNAIKNFPNFKTLKWNVWNINSVKSFNKIIKNENIGIMLLLNNKFTNNLN